MVGWLVSWFVLVQVLSEGIMGKSQWKILEQAFSNTTLTTGPNVSASDKVTHVSALIYVTASLWVFFPKFNKLLAYIALHILYVV